MFCFLAILLWTTSLALPVVADDRCASGGAGAGLTAKEAEELLKFHNKVRQEVGVAPVRWSNSLAAFAQEWANHLAETGELEHRPRTGKWAQKYGENLAINATVLKGAEAWYEEKKEYKPGTPIPAIFANFKAGHYTQMVWRRTTEIGCGKAAIQRGRYKGQLVIVCNYAPPGNFIGEKPYSSVSPRPGR